jgi:HAD superfamily phosphoserine phosphatase-like hydrolase
MSLSDVPPPERALAILGCGGNNALNLRLLLSNIEKVVPFVGAGLSTDFGYPGWVGLLSDLAKEAEQPDAVHRLLQKHDFEAAAQLVSDALPNRFNDVLRDTFNEAKIRRPIRKGAVRHIPKLARGLVLTTNFDKVLEFAFQDAEAPFKNVFPGSKIHAASRAIQLDEPSLLKLHGDYWDPDSQILTLSQYRREYGSEDPNLADLSLPVPAILAQAVSARPLLFLGCGLRNDRTTTVVSRVTKKAVGVIHFAVLPEDERTKERCRQLDLWNIRPLFYKRSDHQRVDEFLAALAESLPKPASRPNSREELPVGSLNHPQRLLDAHLSPSSLPSGSVRINGYKLFYFRSVLKRSLASLSAEVGIEMRDLRRFEKVNDNEVSLGSTWFSQCPKDVLLNLERILSCEGRLEAGKPDDFLTQYMLYYGIYKKSKIQRKASIGQPELRFQTKIVVFDFDGTLTNRTGEDLTTWEQIWVALGYTANECAELHRRFQLKEFTHQEWCDLTKQKFKVRGFSETHLSEIAKNVTLIRGAKKTIKYLKASGIRLYILSGSIRQVIQLCIGNTVNCFEEIKANEMLFDSTGTIKEIRGTPYDFEGKAVFLKRIIEENHVSPLDVLFVGNSCNDVFASLSGVRTLCVNPRFTDPDNPSHWSYSIRRMEDLSEMMEFVNI